MKQQAFILPSTIVHVTTIVNANDDSDFSVHGDKFQDQRTSRQQFLRTLGYSNVCVCDSVCLIYKLQTVIPLSTLFQYLCICVCYLFL